MSCLLTKPLSVWAPSLQKGGKAGWYQTAVDRNGRSNPGKTGVIWSAWGGVGVGWGGGGCWVALSDARKTIVKCVRCSIAAYWITLSYITFMTHMSVSICIYKYNVRLEIEMWVIEGNSNTAFKSKFSVNFHQNLNNPLWGTSKEQSHMATPLSWVYNRTPAIKSTVSKIRHQHTTG